MLGSPGHEGYHDGPEGYQAPAHAYAPHDADASHGRALDAQDTQNELDEDGAKALLDNDVLAVVEGANMPSTTEAAERFREAGILFGPAKAANAGGVAVSGLEMSQNSGRVSWEHEKLDSMLTELMQDIHGKCVESGEGEDGAVDYVRGANIAGFRRVADAMLAFGVV